MKKTFVAMIIGEVIALKKENIFDKEAVEANLALNKILEDSEIQGSTNGLPESVGANLKIQEAFYSEDKKDWDIAPVYLYNNTPAIKINEEQE